MSHVLHVTHTPCHAYSMSHILQYQKGCLIVVSMTFAMEACQVSTKVVDTDIGANGAIVCSGRVE